MLRVLLVLFLLLSVGNVRAQDSDSIVRRYLLESGITTTEGNTVKILRSGRDKFNDLFAYIKQARHHIHLEYFNFRNDSIAAALFHLLAQKAQEGVKVRLMFDAFGNFSNNKPLKKRHLKALKEEGINIVKFDPFRFPYINHAFHRDHRKIAIIDGRIGYTGGMNIADYYINGLPKIGEWHDTHVRIEGTAVHDLQRIFVAMWENETNEKIEGEDYFPPIEPFKEGKEVAIVDRWPRKTPKTMRRVIARCIRSAQHKVQIVNPYFVPTNSIKKEIRKALERGVDVEIMISAKADIPFTPEATLYISHKLMKKGAEVYLFDDGFHHSKIMMIDDSFCTVGSTNLNSRSLRYDYETNAFIFDKETTQDLIEIFEEDKEDSTLMTQEKWKKRSAWKRAIGWFAHLFTPFI